MKKAFLRSNVMWVICQKKNENDELYKALNSYHQILKLNLELDPTNFLDA